MQRYIVFSFFIFRSMLIERSRVLPVQVRIPVVGSQHIFFFWPSTAFLIHYTLFCFPIHACSLQQLTEFVYPGKPYAQRAASSLAEVYFQSKVLSSAIMPISSISCMNLDYRLPRSYLCMDLLF